MLIIRRRKYPLEEEGKVNKLSSDLATEHQLRMDLEDAVVELGELFAEQDDALVELASLIVEE